MRLTNTNYCPKSFCLQKLFRFSKHLIKIFLFRFSSLITVNCKIPIVTSSDDHIYKKNTIKLYDHTCVFNYATCRSQRYSIRVQQKQGHCTRRDRASRAHCDRVYGGGGLVTKCNPTDLNHIPYE